MPGSATLSIPETPTDRASVYAWIEAAQRDTQPDAGQLRLQLARAYAGLGLGLPGAELLRDRSGDAGDGEDVRKLARIAAANSGRQTWGRRTPRFEANLRALEARGVDVALLRRMWEQAQADWQLFVDSFGADHVRTRRRGEDWRWWPTFGDHRAIAAIAAPPGDRGQLMPGPYLFCGVGEGSRFERIWRESRNTFLGYSAAIYVLAADLAAFAAALHLHDWPELLSDPAVLIFLGDQAEEGLSRTLGRQPNLALPRYAFSLAAPDRSTIIDSIANVRIDAAESSLRQAESQYAACDRAFWAARFDDALAGRAAPLRVLATVSTHTSFLQYSMRDALAALRRLGCETRLITEQAAHEIVGAATYHRHIDDFRPDLFFAIDHLRSSFAGKLPRNLPLMTWDQDALTHLFNETTIRKMGPFDTVVGLPQFELIARCNADPRAFLTAHMATSPEQFDGRDIQPHDLDPYRCDVAYVSHASQTAEEFHKAERAGYADANARRLLDAIYPRAIERVRRFGSVQGGQMRELLDQAQRDSGVRVVDPAMRHRLIGWHIWRLCDRAFRHQALEWVANWAGQTGRHFRIYGNGWDRHPTLARYAAGPAANGRELTLVYRAAAINLQLMPAGFLHQRSLDGILSGGFFLTRETTADRRDPRLTPLWKSIRERGYGSAAAIRASHDAQLRIGFEEVRVSIGHGEDEAEKTYQFLRSDSQWDYPIETFPDFEQITFRDAESFAQRAEKFLSSPDQRDAITARLRQIVVERYSYEATMRKFLRFAAAYFAESAC